MKKDLEFARNNPQQNYREQLRILQQRLKELKQDSNIKEMLKLENEIAKLNILTDGFAIYEALLSYNDSNSEGLFIYIGTFATNQNDIQDKRVAKNDDTAIYSLYRHLIEGYALCIDISSREAFENHHKIIFPCTEHEADFDFENAFFKIRQYYLRSNITERNEVIIRKLKNPKKVKQIIDAKD